MKKKPVMRALICLSLCALSFVAYGLGSGTEPKEGKKGEEWQFAIPLVKQPFPGKVIMLLDQAIDLHKQEVGVPLEKYRVIIAEDDEDYYFVFSDAERVPGAIGSRIDVPEYQVTASKKTFKITSHTRLR